MFPPVAASKVAYVSELFSGELTRSWHRRQQTEPAPVKASVLMLVTTWTTTPALPAATSEA